ncbi:cytochrome c oxidase assembly protein [Gryllotalpicola protaetiae]|uniref:Copper transporter n=1 Tax=Gryllotalpicola protaetiae TaxID=2419771 RepID=A0A387BRB4_9MICO|nr:cytochrome c oxidase assembly protein [Gryllotalpicola protaetiae]AYG03507.1 copper transporter [Gryllotalpicola protaetiae]
MNRAQRVAGPIVLVATALVAILAALAFGGGSAPLALSDPGPLVRWGLPVSKLVVDLSSAGVIGALLLSLFALSPTKPEYDRAVDVAAASAAIMTIASGIVTVLSFSDATGTPLAGTQDFSNQFLQFVTQIALGQAWGITTLAAAAATVLCFAVRNQVGLVFVTVLAIGALIPIALQGHAAGTSGHNLAITSLALHIIGAAVWIGGLLTLVLIRNALGGERLPTVLSRYSSLALICFIVVAFSGFLNAQLRVGTWANLLTPYGVLIIGKATVLILLGMFGVLQRRWLIARLRTSAGRGPFWIMVTTELAFMGFASGIAAALARTATPVKQVATGTTPAEILTGQPLPPAETLHNLIVGANVDPIWLLVSVFGIYFYVAGVLRLRRRGDKWPLGRTVSWVAGMLVLAYITNGGVAVYVDYLFSAHMAMHMALMMVVPLLLVPGAPVTLAARAIIKRTDASRGGREWILLAVHSRIAGVLANPFIAALLFVGSLWVFYYSPLFRWATENHLGHEWMTVHFLITGYLFVQSLIGIDPVPFRLAYPFRLVLLLGTMVVHAFFGLTIMTASGLFLADWFGAMGRTWGASPMQDQYLAGGIAWSIGELPTLVLAIVVAVQWSRSDARETKRKDRASDRSGNADVDEYNAMLQRMAERDSSRG